ncbi:MAG: hypothetical protein ACOX4I_04225 [Anaerovoracaceae bacterium]|jgi:hypothetical protein
MSEKIENIIRDYPKKKQELECLKHQIMDFRGISEEDMIDSMCFKQPEGERVESSGTSDKTGKIAVSYKDKMEHINSDWYEYLERKYFNLAEEIRFFESALAALSGDLPDIMTDMIIHNCTWDCLCSMYHVSRTMIAKYRRKAIRELDVLYENHENEMVEYMLS